MIMKILHTFFLILVLLCLGCQRQDTAVITAENRQQLPMKDGDISKSDDNRITTSEDKKYSLMVITYYFHRTMRCPSCREIEANAAKVIAADFKQQLADGKLTWMPFNLDDKGGEELEKEFNISGSTLVLAKVKDGKHTEYKKLEKVWQLMHDSGAFNAYVRDETRRFLSE